MAKKADGAKHARTILDKFGIGIDEAANGVFLPASSSGTAANHSTLHTSTYYRAVNAALDGATTRGEVLGILEEIGKALQAGGFP